MQHSSVGFVPPSSTKPSSYRRSVATTHHTRTVLSELADTNFLPSGENQTEFTDSEQPPSPTRFVQPCWSVCSHSPVATSHTRTVISSPPNTASPLQDTSFLPSGENPAEFTLLVCAPPVSARTHLSRRPRLSQSLGGRFSDRDAPSTRQYVGYRCAAATMTRAAVVPVYGLTEVSVSACFLYV
eukprot:COSAG03_NODE_1634_length_3739_cov_17.806868_4_plen_184_part_00